MTARKLFGDDVSEPGSAGASPSRPTLLRLFTDDDPDGLEIRPTEAGRVRTGGPASSPDLTPTPPEWMPEVWTLRTALNRFRRDWEPTREPATWSQYQTLVDRWERHHGGAGPDVAAITSESLSEFFHAVPEWGSAITWKRYADQFGSLLRSCCRQHGKNREGLPRDSNPPCREDELPFVVLPSADWFREHRRSGEFRSGGHTPKRRSTLTLPDFQRVIDACWTTSGVDPVWWETLFGWLWFSGMRITQSRTKLGWYQGGDGEGIDLASLSLVTHESKCGGLINVPLPDCLRPGLNWLQTRTGKIVFERQNVKNDSAFRKRWNRIWEHAIPVKDDVQRELLHFAPHELRAVSVTNWELSADRAVGHLITGHAPSDTRQACYFVPGDEKFRTIVNRYEMPRLHAAEKALPLG